MENAICDICGSEDSRLVCRVRDTNYGTPGQFNIVQCQQCQLVYLNPRPEECEYADIYPEIVYDPFAAIQRTGEITPTHIQQERGRQLTERVTAGRVLDIGCADGLFLKVMRDLGWSCVGIEPNPRASRFAHEHLKSDVRRGTIFDVNEDTSFNLITLWDVLEHTPSPRAVLLHANTLLTPHGMLALSLPNWDSVERLIFRQEWIALDAPRHFYHFTPATIRRLLETCGFHTELLQACAPVLSLASNVLRQGGNWFLRRGAGKSTQDLNIPERRVPSRKHRLLIRLTHLGLSPLNACINLVNHGASLLIFARKVKPL